MQFEHILLPGSLCLILVDSLGLFRLIYERIFVRYGLVFATGPPNFCPVTKWILIAVETDFPPYSDLLTICESNFA